MEAVVLDPLWTDELIRRRREMGVDQHDEVWDGVYVMSPMANDEHQGLVSELTGVLLITVQWKSLGLVRAGVNISDQLDDWTHNYRCPDVAVFLNDTAAENRGTYWLGGPDFGVEIVSPGDRSRRKLDFYASVSAREILIVDRDPWALELYRLNEGSMDLAGTATVENGETLTSEVVPLTFRLVAGADRPQIEVARRAGADVWRL
jgi:Uma2 family endonuclease